MFQPHFLEGTAGPLFAVHYPRSRQGANKTSLLYIPPFAEEANRSRRMAALQARRIAACGVDVLLLDPYGTGDSAGDFVDARWEIWRHDTAIGAQWLLDQPGTERVGLWGLRLGALLAAEVASLRPAWLERLILWQPVLKGEAFMTQFLRLEIAAAMAAGSEKTTTKALRERLAEGEAIEIAGYELSPELVKGVDAQKMESALLELSGLRIDWLEVGSDVGNPTLLPGSNRLLEKIEETGVKIAPQIVNGEAFWSIQETTLAPELLSATEALFD